MVKTVVYIVITAKLSKIKEPTNAQDSKWTQTHSKVHHLNISEETKRKLYQVSLKEVNGSHMKEWERLQICQEQHCGLQDHSKHSLVYP